MEVEHRGSGGQPLVIMRLGLNYFVKYKLSWETFPYVAEEHWGKSEVWRLVSGVESSAAAYHLDSSCLEAHSLHFTTEPETFLIRENCFAKLKRAVHPENDEFLYSRLHDHALNPSKNRPGWLYRKYNDDGAGEQHTALPQIKAGR
jgi:hypothetical protein